MKAELIYAVLGCVAHYLGARAMITRPLWSRYPRWIDAFMGCAACSGFWWTAGVAVLFGQWHGWSYAGLAGERWYTPIVAGFVGIFTTPVLMWLMQEAVSRTALGDDAPKA